jgi:hypothetical protein
MRKSMSEREREMFCSKSNSINNKNQLIIISVTSSLRHLESEREELLVLLERGLLLPLVSDVEIGLTGGKYLFLTSSILRHQPGASPLLSSKLYVR